MTTPDLADLFKDIEKSDSTPSSENAVEHGQREPNEPVIPPVLPVLPLRGLAVFPGTVVPLNIRRATSRKMLDECLPQSKIIALVAQHHPEQESPGPDDLYKVGVAAMVLKLLRQAEDTLLVVVQALQRIAVRKILATDPYIKAEVEVLTSTAPPADDKPWEAAVKNLRETSLKLIQLTPDVPEQVQIVIMNLQDPGQLADFLAGNLSLDLAQKQDLLEELDTVKRVRSVQLRINNQLEIAQLQQKLQQDVAAQISDTQRRAYLREQVKAIQRELGEQGEGTEEQIAQLRKRLEESKPPNEVTAQAERV
ncbi:MAG: LON peptidase substrate-binding domain-containing protein [Candidatus Omnitrophica bacterium]|nr:LON peptidase substrate-binding domain-containing protein [Candidatus Omnitrophota bacterium]